VRQALPGVPEARCEDGVNRRCFVRAAITTLLVLSVTLGISVVLVCGFSISNLTVHMLVGALVGVTGGTVATSWITAPIYEYS
jgi:preprotein translocase subunit SecF